MNVIARKWGNSLAFRIPSPIAHEFGISDGKRLEMKLENGKITINQPSKRYSLSKLLSEITTDNIHDEVDSGAAQGRESW
jgi:antitoxin MazE